VRPPASDGFKRLLHFQPVAFSTTSGPGHVSDGVCSPTTGWRAHVDNTLRPLVRRLGPDTFDWWGHRTGGSWVESSIPLDKQTSTLTEFEALDVARQRFPQLVDFTPLAEFASANGIELYGYVGFPRCNDHPLFLFTAAPEHCDPDQMFRWYGEFVDFGFKGVGHDYTARLRRKSGALTANFPFLQSHGIEPFIEAIPARKARHLLGWSVVVSERRLLYTESNRPKFFTVDEIREAGGRVVIIVAHAPNDFSGDVWRWRFERSVARLSEGETVAVNLAGLAERGYSIDRLVELSRPSDPGADGEAPTVPDPSLIAEIGWLGD
jgi:hypothetical protein